jgi:hypothetical protein
VFQRQLDELAFTHRQQLETKDDEIRLARQKADDVDRNYESVREEYKVRIEGVAVRCALCPVHYALRTHTEDALSASRTLSHAHPTAVHPLAFYCTTFSTSSQTQKQILQGLQGMRADNMKKMGELENSRDESAQDARKAQNWLRREAQLREQAAARY